MANIDVLKFTGNVPNPDTILYGAAATSYGCTSNNTLTITSTLGSAFSIKYSTDGTTFTTLSNQNTYNILITELYPTFILDKSIYSTGITLNVLYTTYCDATKPCGDDYNATYNINTISYTTTINPPSTNYIYNRTLFATNIYLTIPNYTNDYKLGDMQAVLGCNNDEIYMCYYQRFTNGISTFYSSAAIEKVLICKVQWRGTIGTIGTLTRFTLSNSLDTGTINVSLQNTTAASLETAIKNGFIATSRQTWVTNGVGNDFDSFISGFTVTKDSATGKFNFSYNPIPFTKSITTSYNNNAMYSLTSPFSPSISDTGFLLGPSSYTSSSTTGVSSTSYFSSTPTSNAITLHFNNSNTASTSTQDTSYYTNQNKVYNYACNNSNLTYALNFDSFKLRVISPKQFDIYYLYSKRAQSALLPLNYIDDVLSSTTINNNLSRWQSFNNRFINLESASSNTILANNVQTCAIPRSVNFNVTGFVGYLANPTCQNIKYRKTGDSTWFYDGSITNSANNPLPLNSTSTSVDLEIEGKCSGQTTPSCKLTKTIPI